jgi:nicotinamidase-related amidase
MNRLHASAAAAVLISLSLLGSSAALAQLPDPGLTVDPKHTALVITDPQNDFLSPKGVTWGLVGKNVTANRTVENIEALMKAAKKAGMPVFVSPHFYYPADKGWQFGGAVETMMHGVDMFARKGPLTTEGLEGSGADWLERYKPYIDDGRTIVTSPHKVYGPESNDLALQLRKRGITKVILGGMSANLCVESHLRELLEEGFEIAVVKDATAAAQAPGLDGYAAALVNFRFLASAVWSTQEAVAAMQLPVASAGKATGASASTGASKIVGDETRDR